MFGLSKPIAYGIAAVALVGVLAGAVVWIRKDAQNDILRQIQLNQAESTATSIRERVQRKREIDNASGDDLRRLACSSGLLAETECVD